MNDVRSGAAPAEWRLSQQDRAIVDMLQRNGRLPNNAVAAAVGVAPSTSLARVRHLEEAGVIRGYHAEVALEALGTPLQAMVAVRVHSDARHRLREFTAATRARPEVLNIFFVAGRDDFLVHVAVADSSTLRDFVVDHLSNLAEVAATETHLIFEHVRGAGLTGG